MRIRDLVGRAYSSSFLRAVGVLASGTLLAQGMMLLALPVLTRIYSPTDFSLLAVYISIATVVSTAAALRFDVAIPIPADEDEAMCLFLLGIASSFLVGAGVWGVLVLRPQYLMNIAGVKANFEYLLWLLPLGVTSIAIYSTAQFYIIRRKEFTFLAKSKALQALFSVSTQVGLGIAGLAGLGLIGGYALNYVLGAVILIYLIYGSSNPNGRLAPIDWHSLKLVANKYKNFPKFSTVEALCNAGSIQLPILFIAMAEIGPEAGFLVLAMQIIQAPLSLLGATVGQVFLPNAAERANRGELSEFIVVAIGGLIKAGVGPLLCLGLVAPYIFSFAFGDDWRRAGVLVSWMVPWFIMQFIVSPVSMSLHIVGAQKVAMVLQMVGLLLRVGVVVVGIYWVNEYISEFYAISGFIFYLLYFEAVIGTTGVSRKVAYRQFLSSGNILLAWICLGALIVMLLFIFDL